MPATVFDPSVTLWADLAKRVPSIAAALQQNGSRTSAVSGGAALHMAVAEALSGLPVGGYVANLCCGRDEDGGVSALTAAMLLEQSQTPYGGCSAALLARPHDVLLMMVWYAGLPLAPFAVVSTMTEAAAAAQRFDGPERLRVWSTRPVLAPLSKYLGHPTSAEELQRAFDTYGKMVVMKDVLAGRGGCVYALVSGGATRGAIAVSLPSGTADADATQERMRRLCAAFARDVMHNRGVALLSFGREANAEEWVLGDIQLNPNLAQLPAELWERLDGAALVADMHADAWAAHPQPSFEVRLSNDARKGYSLCAARDVKKGEIVFEDECRSFAIVTRPFVEKNWSDDLKKTFTEYAWPLDSDGHLYAIWETEPTRWRPVNHSCDPTCIFAAPHSLNVIAARDIAAGEELSMDYATFCDGTMRPFRCLCGAACCRGLISPDEATVRKYGKHAWLRRVAPPVEPLL